MDKVEDGADYTATIYEKKRITFEGSQKQIERLVKLIENSPEGMPIPVGDTLDKLQIKNSETAYGVFYPMMVGLQHEEFWIMLLNRANRNLGIYKTSQGGISGTVVDIRIILKKALDNSASALILCHNHPSGKTDPSEADKWITRKVKDAAELLEIKLLDHLVITDTSYLSFADEGII